MSEKKWDSQKRILVYNLNGRGTSINSSKDGYSSKYLKSDSNMTDLFYPCGTPQRYYNRLKNFSH